MKYYIIAGEASGDLHGSNLIKHLVQKDPDHNIRAWGGDLMAQMGADIVKHYRELAFMGFAEVIMNIRTIKRNFTFCEEDLLKFKPDVLILIDYPGFNLRMARFAHKHGIRVFYYISPQIWAWKQSRWKKVKAFVDKMYVILPFEKDFYERFGIHTDFVGHPLIDAVDSYHHGSHADPEFRSHHNLDNRPIIALLPGSRKQEIGKMMPIMLCMIPKFEEYQFVVAGAPSQDESYYLEFLKGTGAKILFGATYKLLANSHAALVTSGTATLETAIFKVPQVVCYKGGVISYYIARLLVKVKYISLVNLIMDREVVKELIQRDFNEKNLAAELRLVANPGQRRSDLETDYDALYKKLGGGGASEKTANLMLKTLRES